MCTECEARINGSLDALNDDETIVNIINNLARDNFCDAFGEENAAQCLGGLEFVLPIAMPTLATADRSWIPGFCAGMECM